MTQTIEQLTARVRELEEQFELAANHTSMDRVRELEEENARLKAESRDASLGLNDYYGRKLVAEQLNNKRLRDALQAYIDEHEECQDADDWMAMMCSVEAHHAADEALSQPSDTSALDTFVAEKVKEAGKFDVWKTNPYTKVLETSIEQLTKQRDLAIEALEKTRGALAYVKANGRDNPNLMESTAWHGLAAADKALSLPASTEALDAYVAEKVKDVQL